MFDRRETLGADLFIKLAMIPAVVLNVVFQTAYYVASHTGSLDRVLRQASSSVDHLSTRYAWRAKVATIVCWIFAA